MKRLVVVMMAAGLLSAALPCAGADEKAKEEKDLCLLYGKQCKAQADSIQEKIRKLQAEIERGERAYSPQEIERLRQKLQEANDILDNLLYHPSRGGASR